MSNRRIDGGRDGGHVIKNIFTTKAIEMMVAVCSHPEREKCNKMEDGLIESWNEKERYMNVKQQTWGFVVVTSYLEKKTNTIDEGISVRIRLCDEEKFPSR